MSTILAIVGLPGAGKTVTTEYLEKKGFAKIYFGAITFEELTKQGLAVNEKNEKKIREALREKYGMAAYAILNLPKIKEFLKNNDKIVIESLYSWQEYLTVKKKFGNDFCVLAIYASAPTRHKRLKIRPERSLTIKESHSRDIAQIENSQVAGPIALANYTIINEGSIEELYRKADELIKNLK